MILDATVGGANANSYVSVSEATALLEGRLHTEPWYTDNTTADHMTIAARRVAALVQATRLLDMHVLWKGAPATTTQALAWPQTGQVDLYGRMIASTVIPLAIRQATAFYALALLRDGSETATQVGERGVKSKRMGDIAITFQDHQPAAAATVMPSEIRLLLRPYGVVLSGGMIPLLRT